MTQIEHLSPDNQQGVREAARHLVGIARAFLQYFNPTNLAEDKSQQWQSLAHQCDLTEAALAQSPSNRGETVAWRWMRKFADGTWKYVDDDPGTRDDVIVEALYPEAPPALAMWQDISTAPRDGTHILVCDRSDLSFPFSQRPPTVAHWFGPPDLPGLRAGGWYLSVSQTEQPRLRGLTHWMPLIEPERSAPNTPESADPSPAFPGAGVREGAPFYGAECPSYPNCSGGCGLGCTHQIELRPGVRDLDWQETFCDRGDGSQEADGWEADNGFGNWYSIEQYFASDSYGFQVKFDLDVIGDFDDPDAAKARAQSHFTDAILSALSEGPRP